MTDCDNCKYLNKYRNNGYIILNFVCKECQRGNVKQKEENKVKGDD